MDVLIDYEKLSCNLYMVKYTSCKCTQLDAFGILQREDQNIEHSITLLSDSLKKIIPCSNEDKF